METSLLLNLVTRLQRRGQAVGSAAALLWSGVACMFALVAAAWLDMAFELSPRARIIAVAIAGFIGLVVFFITAQNEFRKSRPRPLARRLDSLRGTGGQIEAGVDLAGVSLESFASANPALSAGLAALAVRRARSLASGISAARVVPLTPLAKALAASALAVTVLAGLTLLLPGATKAEWLRFRDPYGDHPLYSAVSFQVEPGDASVRYGDSLDLFVTVDGRLVDAPELILQPVGAAPADVRGDVVPMFQEPSGRWRASLAEVKRPSRYFVRARRARSHKFSIAILTVPEIEEVHIRLTPPAYSRLPTYDGPLPEGGLSGLEGTRAEIRIRSNRPLRAALAQFLHGNQQLEEQQWPANPGEQEVTGVVLLDRACRLQIQVIDVEGQPSRDVVATSLTLLPDERPFVRLLEPKATSLATPFSQLPVTIAAEDDLGIARLELFRSLNESRYLPLTIELADEPPRRMQQHLRLPLDQYGLSPGDEIKLFARVEDNDPRGGKGSESSVVTVRIISEEEFEKLIRTRNGLNTLLSRYQEAERRLESVAEQIEQLQKKLAASPGDTALTDELRAELANLAERMQDEAALIEQGGRSPLPYDLDKQLSKNLQRLADQLSDLAKETGNLAGSPSSRTAETAQELERLRKQLVGEKEDFSAQTAPPLEWLSAVYPLIEDEARFTELYQRQRDLVERLSSLRGRDKQDDPALKSRMRDLEAEQQRLQTELVELLDDIDSHAKRLPNRPEFKELRQSAEVFAMLVRRSEAEAAMIQAITALSQFSGTDAHEQARRAADILESFLEKCRSMGEQGASGLKDRFEPGLSEALGNTLSQLLSDGGLGSLGGLGGGRGGGYSARRSSLDNIGLYGGKPMASGPSGARPRGTDATGQGAPRYQTKSSDNGHDEQAGMYRVGSASGGAEAAVPSQYRRRVGKYFQRLADEVGNGEER